MQSQGRGAHMHTLVVFAFEEIEFFYRGRVEITFEISAKLMSELISRCAPWCLTP